MSVLLAVSGVLKALIGVFIVLLWARFILDWVRVLNPRFTPPRVLIVIFELIYTITDPPIRLFRKLIPPLRIGSLAIDFGWLLTMLSCWLIQGLLP